MKRFLALTLSVLMLVSLFAGCGKKEEKPAVDPDVSATDVTATDVTATDTPEDEAQDSNNDNLARDGENIATNGDFSDGAAGWGTYISGAGVGEFAVVDGAGKVTISKTGSLDYAIQFFYDGFQIHEGGDYEFVFTAWATRNKYCEARIQQNGGSYQAYCSEVVEITTEKQTFTIPFTMAEVDGTQRMAFNMGTQPTYGETEITETFDVFFDDIKINVINEQNAIILVEEPVTYALFNQVGYKPNDEKLVYFHGGTDVSSYDVCDEKGNVVLSGKTTKKLYSEAAKEGIRIGDISEITAPGTYYVNTNLGKSYEFTIAEDVYDKSFDSVVKMLYLQRCGCELTAEHSGTFAHPVCHSGKALVYGTKDQFIDVTGGWHDAGDYGRYIVAGAKTVADLLYAYEDAPDKFSDSLGIPESGNGIPDILDETRWELEWMLKMQRADGAVYHKVNTLMFCGNVAPHEDTDQLYAYDISTTSTAAFAASMALAARVYNTVDADFASKCLAAAELAWKFLENNGTIAFHNPSDTNTGEYPDENDNDERFWAAASLFRVTGEEKYHDAVKTVASSDNIYRGKGWADMGSFGTLEYLDLEVSKRDAATYTALYNDFIAYADELMKVANKEVFGISLTEYPWGSNMIVADNGATLAQAYALTGNEEYLAKAKMHFHYIYGLNPMGRSYVTLEGTRWPENPHHRPSVAYDELMPGMLIGGPNQNREDSAAQTYIAKDTAQMKCYIDNFDSYSCNEITIYWNSPLIYLMAVLD